MRTFAGHTIAFGRVFTLVFFLASSGFTTILHLCAMAECECCEKCGASDHDGCPHKQMSAPVAGMSIQNVGDCPDAVAGGLSAIQGLLEKDSKVQNVSVLALFVTTFVPRALNTNTSSFTYSYSESVSPPSVEKYVLNETFLI